MNGVTFRNGRGGGCAGLLLGNWKRETASCFGGKQFDRIVVMACFSVRTLEDTVSLRVRSGEELDCKVTRSLVEFELRFLLFSYCRIRLVFEGDDRKQHVVSGFSTIGSSTVDYKVFFAKAITMVHSD